MNERPWYKRYPSDALNGKIGLELDERGAYDTILDMIYDRFGRVPDDSRYIAGCCGCSLRKWNSLRGKLIEKGKIFINNGEIHNKRADFELAITLKTSRKRAENGAKGGYKSGETRRASSKNKDLAEAKVDSLARARSPEITSKRQKNVASRHKKSTVRASRLPDDWKPDNNLRDWCKTKLGWTDAHVDEVAEQFRDHWHDQGGERARKISWTGTWRNWCKREARPRSATAGKKSMATVAQEMLQEKADASNGRANDGKGDGPAIDLADEDYGPARDQSRPDRLL